ncbi:MAG: VWA domain-containing protein [Calditrichaeota bacterium]|nr:MAG: VWA domain-containing protein [Calditrichota bacterium]
MRQHLLLICTIAVITGFLPITFAQSEQIISAPFGPPSQANQWEKYTIPITAESFNVDQSVLSSVLADVQWFRVRTEMHNGADVGGVDQIRIGDRFASDFDSGTGGWNAAGDGTMEWIAGGGVEDGYIQISDWASGDWHYAVSPLNWSGDWSNLIGQSIEFFYKTDQPSYASVIEISNIHEKRLVLASSSLSFTQGSTATMSVTLNETAAADVTIFLSSSGTTCATVPETAIVQAGLNRVEFVVTIPETAEEGCTAVITASADGYGVSRLTLKVDSESENANLEGRVTDATTGVGIAGAEVSLAGIHTITEASGHYRLEGIPTNLVTSNFTANPRSGEAPLTVQFTDLSGSSSQTLTVAANGYITYESPIILESGSSTSRDVALSPIITDSEFRIVLNWGMTPADLDIYLLVPATLDYSSYYVYYNHKGATGQYPWAILDIDRRQGFGPETITIEQLIPSQYVIFVHNYSHEASLTASEGIVQIYSKTGLQHTISVPTTGEGNYWYIGDLDGATKQVTLKNILVPEQPRLMGGFSGLAKESTKINNIMDLTSWEWDFDDDGTIDATDQNPVYTYTLPGAYTVALRVNDGVNTYTERKTNYINVTSPETELSGYQVSLTNIDISNFPLIKCFVSVIDEATGRPAPNLISVNFQVTEEELDVNSLTVQHINRTSGGRADIAYIFDTTGSMGDEIETLKNRALAFADSLAKTGIDYRLGLVTFGDEIRSIHDFTASASEFKTWIESLVADGGDDTNENALEGLAAGSRLTYREMTQRITIIITDADYHEQGETGDGTTSYTTDSIISLMNSSNMQVNVVGPDLTQYQRMAAETGGQFYNILSDFSNIIDRIGESITSQYVVTYVPQDQIADGEWRNIKIQVINGETGGLGTGRYFIGPARLLTNPPVLLGRMGESYNVDIRVENVADLASGHWLIDFDETKLEAVAVFEGDFFSRDSSATTFSSEIKNSEGYVEITAARSAGAASPSVSGSGLLARITFRMLIEDCTSQLLFQELDFRHADDESLELITAGTQIRSAGQVGDSDILCDFDEDLDIDTHDFALLSTFWKPSNSTIGDVGPASGAIPLLTPGPDGKVDYEDLFVFTRMWNWYHGAVDVGTLALGKPNGAQYSWREQHNADGSKRMTLMLTDIEKLAMGHLVFHFNADAFDLQSVREGTLLTADDGVAALMVEEKNNGLVDVTLSRLTPVGQPAEVFGNGAMLTLDFRPISNGDLNLSTEELDLRTARNHPIYIKTLIEEDGQTTEVQLPQVFTLINRPNPFNSRTIVEFTLPLAAKVKMEIVNILGQPIRQLIDAQMEAGLHKITWDGVDDNGTAAVTGMYLIRLQADRLQLTRKILYLK